MDKKKIDDVISASKLSDEELAKVSGGFSIEQLNDIQKMSNDFINNNKQESQKLKEHYEKTAKQLKDDTQNQFSNPLSGVVLNNKSKK